MVVIHREKFEGGVVGDLERTHVDLRVARGCGAVGGVEDVGVGDLCGNGDGKCVVVNLAGMDEGNEGTLAEAVAFGAETYLLVFDVAAEAVPNLVLARGPKGFAEGQQTRQQHVFGHILGGEMFSGEYALGADDIERGAFLCREGYGVESVDVGEGGDAVAGSRLVVGVGLIAAEETVVGGAHDDLVARLCGTDTRGEALGADDGTGNQGSGVGKIPRKGRAVELTEVLSHLPEEPDKELVVVMEVVLEQSLAAFVASFPVVHSGFKASDVDIFRCEEFGHFVEDVVDEEEGGVVAGAEDGSGGGEGTAGDGVGAVVTRELGIGGENGGTVTWEFDGGNDFDAYRGGICNNLADVLFGIESAVGGTVVAARDDGVVPVAVVVVDAPGTNGVQQRIFLRRNTPGVIVGQMPHKAVHLVVGHEVEHLLDEEGRIVVAADIEVESAPGIARIVNNGAGGEGNGSVGAFENVGRQHLNESLVGVEEALLAVGGKGDAVGGNLETVALVTQSGVERVADDELHDAALVVTHEVGLDVSVTKRVENVFHRVGVLPQAGDGDGDIVLEEERLLVLLDGDRLWNNLQVVDFDGLAAGRHED